MRERMGLAPDSTVSSARRPTYLQLVKKEAARAKNEAAEREKAAATTKATTAAKPTVRAVPPVDESRAEFSQDAFETGMRALNLRPVASEGEQAVADTPLTTDPDLPPQREIWRMEREAREQEGVTYRDEIVDLDSLVTSQETVVPTDLERIAPELDLARPLGKVMEWNGRLLVTDGNHRLAIAKLGGAQKVMVSRLVSPSTERGKPETPPAAPQRLERFASARERPVAAESYVPATQERGQVVMADGTTHDIRYEVVEASDLIPSNTLRGEEVGGRDPRFLAELQPRDLSKVEEREKVRAIAQNPDPRRLGRSQTAGLRCASGRSRWHRGIRQRAHARHPRRLPARGGRRLPGDGRPDRRHERHAGTRVGAGA